MKAIARILLLVLIATLAACADDAVKPPSDESASAKASLAALEGMRTAYVERDFDAFRAQCATSSCGDALSAFKPFDSVTLEFTPRRLAMRSVTDSTMEVSWTGIWKIDGQEQKRQGTAMFVLSGKPLKLIEITRSNPFSEPK